jgi:hypothetical protein
MIAPGNVVADLASLRALIVDEVLSRPDLKAKRERGLVTFCCPLPGHDDGTASAALGEYAWNCKGCGGQGNGRLVDLAAVLGMDVRISGGRGYTVDDYAVEKGLPAHKLEGWGLTTEPGKFGTPVVYVPYYGLDGALLRRRLRLPKRAGKKNQFWEGEGGSIPGFYGLWLLAKAPKDMPVVLVEGESDCHALWTAGLLALGLPGADTWSHCRWALEHLQGREVYVWEEPDKGGAIILRAVAGDFPNARVIRGADAGAKDPCALRGADPDAFRERMLSLMQKAERIGTPKPPFVFDIVGPELLERLGAEKQMPISAVPTHLEEWNKACGGKGGRHGIAHGWYVIIAGATGGMKSLSKDNFQACALMNGERVCLVSMEMDQSENLTRLLAIMSGEPVRKLEHGERFDPEAWRRASNVYQQVREDRGGDLFINREEVSSLDDICDSMDYYWEYHGCTTFVLDYLQLAWVKHASDPQQQITEVSHAVRARTKRNQWATVALSQITREAEKAMTTPVPANLFGGKALESDAVQVWFLDHSRVRRAPEIRSPGTIGVPVPERERPIETVFYCGKNRVGHAKFDIPIQLDPVTLRISEREKRQGEEW